MRGLNRDKFNITLALGNATGPYIDLLPKDIELISLGQSSGLRSVPAICRLLRSRTFDVSFSMLSMNLAILTARSLTGKNIPVVLGARNHYSRSITAEARFARAKLRAVKVLYPRADLIICVSEGVRDDLVRNFGIPRERSAVIHNPIELDTVRAAAENDPGHPWLGVENNLPVLVAVGKLQKAKAYDDLIEAFSMLRRQMPIRLLVLGEGPERAAIEAMIAGRKLTDDVQLLGFQKNPYQYMARATAFVHAARWEGFPNVLVEAMACGLPVVATDCPSGPAEIITNGCNGCLTPVNSPDQLADAVIRLLKEPQQRASFAAAGHEVAKRFATEYIVREYERTLDAIAHRSATSSLPYPGGVEITPGGDASRG